MDLDGWVYLFGNGGSASLFCVSSRLRSRKRYRLLRWWEEISEVLALTGQYSSTLTAWANDSSYEDVFSEQLRNFVQPHDVAFAISGSGNSKNVLNALAGGPWEARATTLGISGFAGGEMKSLCDICAVVPSDDMQIIEDMHVAMAHSIFRIVHTL